MSDITTPVKPISEIEEKSEVSVNDKILILDSVSEEARLASKEELKGDKWDQWEKWDTWDTWPQWPKGDKGDKWDTWDRWPQWVKGDTWAKWDKGDKGETGAKWDTWEKGDKWDKGDQWERGYTWPQGEKWDKGDAATITVGSTTTWEPWSSASVTNSGTTWAAVLDFVIPEWAKWEQWEQGETWETWASIVSAAFSGDDIIFTKDDSNTVILEDAKISLKWDKGDTWATWAAATITVWTTTTWNPWTDASVTNSGTTSAAVLDFTIPKWAKGDTWTAATITVWSTTTGGAWTSASVTNSWSTSAAVLDFTIPKGDKWDKWDTGNTGATWNWIASITSSKSWKITTVTITETGGTVDSFQISDWEDWEWAGDVLWPSSSTDWNVVLFDWVTWKLIKDSTKQFTPAWIGALPISTKYWASITVSVDTTDYKITTTLKDQDWNTLGTAQVIDLPLESVVVSGSYDSVNKKVVLTLENGNTIEFSVADLVSWLQSEITSSNKLDADLVDDSTSTNKFVTAGDKTTWGWKQDKLVAGTNIQIAADWKTISATDTTYSAASSSSLWLVKLGSDTAQSVAANAVSGTAGRTYALQTNSSWQLVVNIPRTDTTYTASSFDIKDLADSTSLRATWSWKQDALSSQTAYTSKWSATKVPQISTNNLGQVTGITEVTITQPTKVSDLQNDSWFITGITSWDVTTALWYTPYNSTNPSGYVTSSIISDTAYWSWWDSDTTHAPTKNAVYDKLNAMDTTIAWKQAALTTQTAYTSKGSATKVPQITTNTLGQVTWITEVTITQPTVNNATLTVTQNGTSVWTFTANAGTDVTIATTDTTYESKAADSGWTAVSLVTTWEKYTWDNKQNALTSQTAYTSKGTATKVATISTNTLWQVTAITETNITFPVESVNWQTWAVSLTIPTISPITVTLTSAWWSSSTQTVSATGVTASNTVIVSPAPANISDYADNGVYCYSQGSGTLTFKCSSTPSSNITVNVVILS